MGVMHFPVNYVYFVAIHSFIYCYAEAAQKYSIDCLLPVGDRKGKEGVLCRRGVVSYGEFCRMGFVAGGFVCTPRTQLPPLIGLPHAWP